MQQSRAFSGDQVIKVLGKGSYGTAYKAKRLSDGKIYAIKVRSGSFLLSFNWHRQNAVAMISYVFIDECEQVDHCTVSMLRRCFFAQTGSLR